MASRAWVNFWLDSALLIVFCGMLVVTTIVNFVFPPPLESAGWTLWGATYGQWATLQFFLVSLLALGVLLHVMLHWTWVCGLLAARWGKRSKSDSGTQTLYGVGLLIVLLTVIGVAVAAAQLSIQRPSYAESVTSGKTGS